MTVIVFRNKGVLDPRSISTFGVSSKDNDKAIGFFGTGLKYAIAILLRMKCSITIVSGGTIYNFDVVREKIRNDEFDLVRMNGVPLGFTTELGKTWEIWQAFRELYCNAIDEHGTATDEKDITALDIGNDETAVVVGGEPFMDTWHERSKVILSTPPLEKLEGVHIHRGTSKYLYYRGIRVYTLAEPSLYTYNIQAKMSLTEDRTLSSSYWADHAISAALAQSKNREIITHTVCAGKGTKEAVINFEGCNPSEEWLDVVMKQSACWAQNLNLTARKNMTVFRLVEVQNEAPAVLTPIDEERLSRAITFLQKLGWDVTKYPIIPSDHLGEDVLGRAHEGKIYLSTRCFMLGTKVVAGTLLEEFVHLKEGYPDYSLKLQNWLVDAIIHVGELHTGDVL